MVYLQTKDMWFKHVHQKHKQKQMPVPTLFVECEIECVFHYVENIGIWHLVSVERREISENKVK